MKPIYNKIEKEKANFILFQKVYILKIIIFKFYLHYCKNKEKYTLHNKNSSQSILTVVFPLLL